MLAPSLRYPRTIAHLGIISVTARSRPALIGISSVFRLDLPSLLFPRLRVLKRPRRRSNRRAEVERLKERPGQVDSDRKTLHRQAAFEKIGPRVAFRSSRHPRQLLCRRVTGHLQSSEISLTLQLEEVAQVAA